MDDDIEAYLAARRKRFPKADGEKPAPEVVKQTTTVGQVEKYKGKPPKRQESRKVRTTAIAALEDRCQAELLVEALKYLSKEYSLY